MKNTRRILALLMTAVLICGVLAGCSKSPAEDSGDGKKYKVGICQLVQHDALDAATKGFQDALVEKLGAENVEFDLQNAAGESSNCATIVNQFVSAGDIDLIMANATPALQAAMTATPNIPIVATSITDFATALEAKEWNGKTGINVTGTADLAPLDKQAEMISELCPEAKTVGILYSSAEANSAYQVKVIEEALDKLSIAYKEYTISETNEIAAVVTKACDEVDVIYIPTDNAIASATAAVNEVAAQKNIPIVAGEEGICKGCGIATLSISYYDIGYRAGEMAYEILVNGKNPGDMEIEYAKNVNKKFIKDRCDALKITVPEDYEAIDTSAE